MLPHVIGSSLHYLATFLLVGTLVAQLYVQKLTLSLEVLKLSARIDRVYGISSILVLASGLSGVFHNGKGLPYYLHNGAFHAAITLFILAGLISLIPTLRLIRWSRAANAGALPSAADWAASRKWVHIQLGIVTLIVFCMSSMARGVGSF